MPPECVGDRPTKARRRALSVAHHMCCVVACCGRREDEILHKVRGVDAIDFCSSQRVRVPEVSPLNTALSLSPLIARCQIDSLRSLRLWQVNRQALTLYRFDALTL